MPMIGCFFSSEERTAGEIVELARRAEQAGFETMIAYSVPCGPDPDRHATAIQAFFDEMYVQQIGPDQGGFLRFYERKVLPRFA